MMTGESQFAPENYAGNLEDIMSKYRTGSPDVAYDTQGLKWAMDNAWKTGDAASAALGDRMAQYEQFGPLGEKYSGTEQGMIDRLQGIGADQSEFGGNVKKFMQDIALDKSGLQNQLEGQYGTALSGGLTDADSEFLQRSLAARMPAFEDSLRAVREAAGQQRGLGGGRVQDSLRKMGEQFNAQSLADIAQMQSDMTRRASDYVPTIRGQDINLTDIAAGLQKDMSGKELAAQGQLGGHLQGMGNLQSRQDDQRLEQARFDQDRMNQQIQNAMRQSEFAQSQDLNERLGIGGMDLNKEKIGQDAYQALMDSLQTDKYKEQELGMTPQAKLQNLIQGIGGPTMDIIQLLSGGKIGGNLNFR
jgi:hypothetical protein